MLLSQQSTVVDSTLRELMDRNKVEKAHHTTVLALLFFHMNGMNNGLKGLKELHENNVRVRICPDERILDYYSVTDLAKRMGIDDWISLRDLEFQKEKIDHIYIPILPFSTVSDLLHFNDARPSIRILLWALMNGKKVSALSAGADPYHSIWQEAGMNHGTTYLKHEMKMQLQRISRFGINLIDNADSVRSHFLATCQTGNKRVITADEVRKLAKAGQHSLELERGTIITPLARDMARSYQIKIGEK